MTTPPRRSPEKPAVHGSKQANEKPRLENGKKTRRVGDGTPGPGRPKGRLNDATLEVRIAARALVEDPEYRENLRSRLVAGELPPPVECMLWHYAYGKPKETVAVEVTRGPVALPEQRPLSEWQEAFGEVLVPRNGNGHREGVN